MAPIALALLLALTLAGASPNLMAAAESEGPTTTYLELKPAFTINVGAPGVRLSYAKVDITLRLHDGISEERVLHHQPGIRDSLVSLLSNQPLDKVENGPTRELLRISALENIQAYLEQEEGDPLVSDLLFTSFIVQR